jgi:hypothetical protein
LIDFAPLKAAFPFMRALRKISFRFSMTPPAQLLFAASSAPYVDALEFTNLRIDDPFVIQSFFNFPYLTSLSMSLIDSDFQHESQDVRAKEISNVACILRALSDQLRNLEISGGLVTFPTLMDINWPRLQTFVILDHMPRGPILALSFALSKMPNLTTLGYTFKYGPQKQKPLYPFQNFQPPPEVDQLIMCKEYPRLPPRLKSVNISSVPPNGAIFSHLPSDIEVLRVLPRIHREVIQTLLFHESDAIYIIEKASRFDCLVELSITIFQCPSPTLISAIVKACPAIRILELGQTGVIEREPVHTVVSSQSNQLPRSHIFSIL